MQTAFLKNIINAEMLNKKNRYVFYYVSVFFVLMFSIVILSSFKPNNDNGFNNYIFHGIDDTIYVYDTVYYYDTTFFYDTVYVDSRIIDTNSVVLKKVTFNNVLNDSSRFNIKLYPKNNFPYGKYLFSLDFSFSPMFFRHSFTSDFIYDDVSKINKTSIQERLSSKFGFGLNLHNQYTTISSGFFLSKYNESFNYLVTDFLIDTILAYRYFTTTEMKIDTVEFFNIDSLLIGDTVIEYYYDTTRMTQLDSTLVPKADSVKFKKNDKANNSFRFIEIPLIFNFNFYRPNMSISPQIGIITSFFMNSEGKIVSLADINQSIDIEKETKFAKVNFSIYAGMRINYFLSKRFDFFTSLYFRRNLNSLFVDYPIVSRFNTFGLNFGIRYKIGY